MLDEVALNQLFSTGNAAWTGVALLLLFIWRMWNVSPAMFAQWIEWRKSVAEAKAAEANRVAAEKAADWSRLREEITRLSDAERKCREDFDILHDRFIERESAHAEEMVALKSEISILRGYMEGRGNARQEVSGILAIERLKDDRDKKQPD